VRASSRSDARGVFGMTDAEGELVHAGPHDMQLQVRNSAHGVSPERLRALVQDSHCCSPVSDALQTAVPVALRIDVDTA
jgi:organic hydroperoxide reductase OsmC/OhrA